MEQNQSTIRLIPPQGILIGNRRDQIEHDLDMLATVVQEFVGVRPCVCVEESNSGTDKGSLKIGPIENTWPSLRASAEVHLRRIAHILGAMYSDDFRPAEISNSPQTSPPMDCHYPHPAEPVVTRPLKEFQARTRARGRC